MLSQNHIVQVEEHNISVAPIQHMHWGGLPVAPTTVISLGDMLGQRGRGDGSVMMIFVLGHRMNTGSRARSTGDGGGSDLLYFIHGMQGKDTA